MKVPKYFAALAACAVLLASCVTTREKKPVPEPEIQEPEIKEKEITEPKLTEPEEKSSTQEETEAEVPEAEMPSTEVPKGELLLESALSQIIAEMTLEEKIAQLFVIAPEQCPVTGGAASQTEFTQSLKEALARYPVGGFIFFAQNIKNPAQLKNFTRQLKEATSIPPIIAVDEEGGRVARLANTKGFGLPVFTSMGAIGASGDVENARKAGQLIGSYLAEYGFTLDFAPDVDVNTNPKNIVIGDRAFGSDPELVAGMAGAFLDGLHSVGVKGCIKPFPGHGDTTGDTHADYVAVTKDWGELKECELIPFIKNFSAADCVMIAHLSVPNITRDGLPASLSKELISGKLRGDLGYDGVVLTDALNMGAIEKNYADGEAAVLAFEAGNDILLMPNDFAASYNAMLEAVKSGRIAEKCVDESVMRILLLKGL